MILIPGRIQSRLTGSAFEGAVAQFNRAVSQILEDNKTPFFPAYTDHGSRHHARLAHEIAWYGFPGLGATLFTALMESQTPNLADIIGLIARSHGESLRWMTGRLASQYGATHRPAGVLAVYHMALLRVADYLQLESDRALSILLKLKTPVSPASVQEWRNHSAVGSISWDCDDPQAIHVALEVYGAVDTGLQPSRMPHEPTW